MLAREGLPEKVRLEKTRELEALTGVAVENKQSERERKMAVRYHKVKFFERVKLTRSIEKLERDNPGGERSAEVDAQLARLREDLHYVLNFPKGYKYVSILKREGDTEHLERKREKLRQKIKENMVADAALAEANEGGEAAAAAAAMGASAAVVEKDDFFMAATTRRTRTTATTRIRVRNRVMERKRDAKRKRVLFFLLLFFFLLLEFVVLFRLRFGLGRLWRRRSGAGEGRIPRVGVRRRGQDPARRQVEEREMEDPQGVGWGEA